MPLRLDVTADSEIRKQILDMVRAEVRPLAYEAVAALVTEERIEKALDRVVQSALGDPAEFRAEARERVMKSLTYGDTYKIMPEEVRREARRTVDDMIRVWIESTAKKEIAALVRDVFKNLAV